MGKTLFQKNVRALKVQKAKDMIERGVKSDDAGNEIGMTGSGVRSLVQRERQKEQGEVEK